jgi:hypothetical protein
MQSLETQCAVQVGPGGRNERGQDQVAAAVELLHSDLVCQGNEGPRPQHGWGLRHSDPRQGCWIRPCGRA